MTAALFPTRAITRVITTHTWSVEAGALVLDAVTLALDCGHTANWSGLPTNMPKRGDLNVCLSCPTADDLEYVDVSGCGNFALLRREVQS